MKILFTGRGGAPSWQMRGEQLGAALNATVLPNATVADIRAHDLVVVVKRVPPELLVALKTAGVPWVYDVVDGYTQAPDYRPTRAEARRRMLANLRVMRPNAVIWANAQMREDCGNPTDPVIYHHHRVDIRINPIRPAIRAIAYEGSPRYIKSWLPDLLRLVQRRGWAFLLNPSHLADADIVLGIRGEPWANDVTNAWKSNVKLANAHGSGTPFIGMPEQGCLETAVGGERWIESRADLNDAFDDLLAVEKRRDIHHGFIRAAYPVTQAAADLRVALECIYAKCRGEHAL